MSDKKHTWKKKPSMGKFQKILEECGNIIQHLQIWIQCNLGFSGLSRLQKVDFVSFYLFSHFLFDLFFIFSIFRTLGLGLEVISHISHIWWCGHNIDHRTWEKKVEGSGTKWCHTTWILHVDLMLYTWSFKVGCTVASTDHL